MSSSVTFVHPILGRFTDDISDSEPNSRTRTRTRSTATSATRAQQTVGRPGSRRFRRYLNSVLSDYEQQDGKQTAMQHKHELDNVHYINAIYLFVFYL
jgi:hypothetical protein